MRRSKTPSAEDFALMSSFEEVRKRLLEERDAEHLGRSLAHWALPSDRRLPYALLNRPVGELVHMPFETLAATPGIGRKKILSLLMLLRRALVQASPPKAETVVEEPVDAELHSDDRFDPARVSESRWEIWCATVRDHHLGRETLGRLAPTLQTLPTVIWNTPLHTYLDLSVSDIRRLKTHGDKRVRAVLEIFHTVHRLLGNVTGHRRLAIRLLPRFVAPLEHWITSELRNGDVPDVQEVLQQLVLPLLNQIELDAGETVHRLAAGRLGIETSPESVRKQSIGLGVTRARVYQLLDMCARVMEVRWPEGKWQLAFLDSKFIGVSPKDERRLLVHEICQLMFPGRSQPAVDEAVLASETV